MAIRAQTLFELARQVELEIAALYVSLSGQLEPGSKEAGFFAHMAAQEQTHAEWVDEMAAGVDPEFLFAELEEADFRIMLATVDDVRDEVLHNNIKLEDALEIIVHLENSTAEEFYLKFPTDILGMPPALLQRMIGSCRQHAREVRDFQLAYNLRRE